VKCCEEFWELEISRNIANIGISAIWNEKKWKCHCVLVIQESWLSWKIGECCDQVTEKRKACKEIRRLWSSGNSSICCFEYSGITALTAVETICKGQKSRERQDRWWFQPNERTKSVDEILIGRKRHFYSIPALSIGFCSHSRVFDVESHAVALGSLTTPSFVPAPIRHTHVTTHSAGGSVDGKALVIHLFEYHEPQTCVSSRARGPDNGNRHP
jgi:hypothetical protein